MEIKIENMKNPPDKMRLMFEAVSELIRQQRDISTIKVQDITAEAGIGKGTAYEYFSSKEEIIANALMYDYCKKMQMLAMSAFEPEDFKDRCYKIMDWIKENKEYNQMFSQLMNKSVGMPPCHPNGEDSGCQRFGIEASKYVYELIDKFMEEGYEKGAFTEKDVGKRSLALLTAMVEYAFVVMGPNEFRYSSLGDEGMRAFVYNSLIRALT